MEWTPLGGERISHKSLTISVYLCLSVVLLLDSGLRVTIPWRGITVRKLGSIAMPFSSMGSAARRSLARPPPFHSPSPALLRQPIPAKLGPSAAYIFTTRSASMHPASHSLPSWGLEVLSETRRRGLGVLFHGLRLETYRPHQPSNHPARARSHQGRELGYDSRR